MRPGALFGLLAGVVLALAARGRIDVVGVRGRSMAPTLLPGDRLIVVRDRPRPGRLVLARDPRDRRRELIKRVARVDGASVWLAGDNRAASTDARSFGAVPAADVTWRAIARYWPPRRVAVLRSSGRPRISRRSGPARSRPEATPTPTH